MDREACTMIFKEELRQQTVKLLMMWRVRTGWDWGRKEMFLCQRKIRLQWWKVWSNFLDNSGSLSFESLKPVSQDKTPKYTVNTYPVEQRNGHSSVFHFSCFSGRSTDSVFWSGKSDELQLGWGEWRFQWRVCVFFFFPMHISSWGSDLLECFQVKLR